MRSGTVLAAVVALLVGGAAPVLVKLGTVAPDGSPWQQLLREMDQEWQRISGGAVTLRVYPGGVLGDETDLVKKLRIGQLHAVALSGAGMEHLEPAVTCLQLPLIFDTYEELDHVRDRLAPMLEQSMAAKGYVVLNWSDAGWVMFFLKTPAARPADIRKMKLFTSASDSRTLELYKAAGFRPVPLSVTDMQSALQTGMIDAFDVPPLLALLNQWFPSAPNMVDVKWAPLVGATVIGKKTWERIPAELRPALARSAAELGVRYRARIRQMSDEAVTAMEKRGMRIIHTTEEDRAAWRTEAENAWPKLRGSVCPEAMFDEVVRLRGEYRAAHGGAP
ncbi:MAG: TRAP transporter substrate-binding protein DctP [Deltaproteobacteria bacterium]|nr:TRAP transporter substrate-binding protein DctP [Deltaproteobacteria bacterium]